MKRLCACIGFTMFITFIIVFYFEFYGGIAVCGISLLLTLLAILVKRFKEYRTTLIFIAIIAMLSNMYSFCYSNFIYGPKAQKYLNNTVVIEATVVENMGSSYNTYFYEADTFKVNGKEEKLKVILKSPLELDVQYKDKIKCKVVLSQCEYPIHKSYKAHYMAQSDEYYLNCKITKVEDKGLLYYPIQIRNVLIHNVKTLIPGHQGELCSAIALGDKKGLSINILDEFEKTGLTHIIVVSGMHMSVLVSFLLFLMRGFPKLTRYNVLRFVIVMLFVVLFVSVTGFQRSAVRSGIMVGIVVLGMVVRRQYDGLSALGFAAILQAIVNPYIIADVGVLLTYSAVLGIMLLFPSLHNYAYKHLPFTMALIKAPKDSLISIIYISIRKIILYIEDILLLSVSAVLFVMPVTAIFFKSVTPASIIFSLFLSLASDIMLITTLLCGVLKCVPVLSAMSYPFAFISYLLATFMTSVIRVGIVLGLTQIYINSVIFIIWFIIFGIFVICALYSNHRKTNLCFVAMVSFVMIIIMCLAENLITSNSAKLKVYPCGKGITVVFQNYASVNVLSCGGDAKCTTDVLNNLHQASGVIDFMAVPSTRKTETRYAADILSEFDVRNILLYYMSSTNEKVFDLAENCYNTYDFTRDETYKIRLSNDYTDVFFNVDSHTYQYIYGNNKSALIIPAYGDCEEIPEEYRSADLVVVCQEPYNLDLISYDKMLWSSDEPVPEDIENIETIGENSFELILK